MKLIPLAGLCVLASCVQPPQQAAQMQTINKVICQQDAALQPVVVTLAAPVVAVTVPQSAPMVGAATAVDTMLLHPAIVAACASVNAVPVAVK